MTLVDELQQRLHRAHEKIAQLEQELAEREPCRDCDDMLVLPLPEDGSAEWTRPRDITHAEAGRCGRDHVVPPSESMVTLGFPPPDPARKQPFIGQFVWNGSDAWVMVHWCPGCGAYVRTI